MLHPDFAKGKGVPRSELHWLVQHTPVSYRTIKYGYYNKNQADYFGVDHNDPGLVTGKQLVDRWNINKHPKDESLWKVVKRVDTDRNVVFAYVVSLKHRPAKDITHYKHEDQTAAVYFAFKQSPDFIVHHWSRELADLTFVVQTSDGRKEYKADVLAVLENGGEVFDCFIENEQQHKSKSRVKKKMARIRAALKQGAVKPNTRWLWFSETAKDRDWLLALAREERLPANAQFVVLPDFLRDPATTEYKFVAA